MAATLLVSPRQKGNPVLDAIRNVPWKYEPNISADYILSDDAAALFLSLRYHMLHPNYLQSRLRDLDAPASLRIVLLLVDSDISERPLVELTMLAHRHDATLLIASSTAEAARYLETFRAYARRSADSLRERVDATLGAQLAEILTTNRLVNKTDAATLHGAFSSLAGLIGASERELAQIPGIGPGKVRRLREAFTAPFVPRYAKSRVNGGAAGAPSGATADGEVTQASEQSNQQL